ncbi:MAG: response regulator [Chloroflexaceae bacterium]|nr:response regulator [Chloroflexaceae bacterium]
MVKQADMIQFQQQFARIRREFEQSLPQKLAAIDATWQHYCQFPADNQILHDLHHQVHGLTGSGQTFGFPELTTSARTLEQHIQSLITDQTSMTAEQHSHIEQLIQAVHQSTMQPEAAIPTVSVQAEPDHEAPESPQPMPAASTVTITAAKELVTQPIQTPPSFITPAAPFDDNRLIFLVEDDDIQANDLVLQIGHFGYTVQTFKDPDALLATMQQVTPAAIIMDIMFPSGELAGTESIRTIQACVKQDLPIMFISAKGDMRTRLQAVRVGGQAYFTKPINVSSLIDKLDELTRNYQPDPYRILIIEDDYLLAQHYRSILEQHHMITMVIDNPLQVLQPLVEFRPDLILMDVYMPGCTGLELALVIRQQEAYVGIPIVFLSAETNLEKRLKAMHLGGDDFLTKPIQAEHLISAVTSRTQRSRILRASMVRDSLTGLLNHTATKEMLEREVALASRRHSRVAFTISISITSSRSMIPTVMRLVIECSKACLGCFSAGSAGLMSLGAMVVRSLPSLCPIRPSRLLPTCSMKYAMALPCCANVPKRKSSR